MQAILSKYKYEIYFFYALPGLGLILGGMTAWLFPYAVKSALSGFSGNLLLNFGLNFSALLLFGVAYRWVRRLERPFLLALWQGKIALLLLNLLFDPISRYVIWETGIGETMTGTRVVAAFQTAIVVVLLSWFALKVSKQGFLRAASYVVLMYLYGPYFLSVIDFIGNRQGAVGVVLLAITASLLLLIVGVWAVSREGDVGTAGLSLMFVASWLSSLSILLFLFGRTIGGYVWWDVLLEWDIWHVTLPHTIPHVTYVIGTLCLAYLLHRYLQQRQGGRLKGTLDEDSIMHVSDAPSGLAAFQRGRKPLDRKIALSLFGLALTIPTIILPGWKWWLANVIM